MLIILYGIFCTMLGIVGGYYIAHNALAKDLFELRILRRSQEAKTFESDMKDRWNQTFDKWA